MYIVVFMLRVCAILLAAWAINSIYYAMWFRLEGADELAEIKQIDLVLGAALGIAVVLYFLPAYMKQPRQCLLILGSAALVWFCVSGSLISLHEWQDRVRSGL